MVSARAEVICHLAPISVSLAVAAVGGGRRHRPASGMLGRSSEGKRIMSEETFEALLAANLRFLRTLVYTRLGRAGHAEDIIQEVLLRAYTRRNQLREEAKFKTWVWSIAVNEIRQHFRRERELVSLGELPGFDIRDRTVSPLGRVERIEMLDWIRAGMAQLSKRDQAAIRVRDIEERSLQEAAVALRRSVSATKSAHFRARKRLADVLRSTDRCPTCNSVPQAA